jgi:nucleotide-binding universal stress UspA family protein
MKALWEEGLAKMRQMAWSLNGTVNAQTAMQEGLPWEEIAIKSQEADLLVIGKSCEKAGGRLFSRRTAQRVIANAACPVLVV